MGRDQNRPLSEADKEAAFRQATGALPRRYADAIRSGMTDEALESALKDVLGIFGGSARPGRLYITHMGSGLRIWGGWHIVNHLQEPPLFSGQATIAMARIVYGIADPNDPQLSLL